MNARADDDWVDAYERSLDRDDRRNQPRTKRRPAHESASAAMVVGVDRGRYRLYPEQAPERTVTAHRAKELSRTAIVVGDRVDCVGDLSGAEGSLARIVRVHPRDTVLRRSADDSDQFERVIVANADTLMMVVAATDPEPRPRLIDRYTVAALDAGIAPILCVTKTDLASADELSRYVSGLDIPVFALRSDGEPDDLAALLSRLTNRLSVAVGASGVGKSTLVNRLVPDADRDVGEVNVVTGRGRHTSSSSQALWLPDGGWIVDTPGVRSFGLGHVSPESIELGFPDLADYLAQCPRGCQHQASDTECGLQLAHASAGLDELTRERIDSLVRLRAVSEHAGWDAEA